MTEAAQHTIDYFSAPANYFWRWAEGGEVIEWVDGTTICYRDELAELIKGLDEENLPPLSCILLVLAACHDNWKGPLRLVKILQDVIVNISESGESESKTQARLHPIKAAVTHLSNINGLPTHLRKGDSRKHLLREIFNRKNSTVKQGVIEEFCTGKLHAFILARNRIAELDKYTQELHLLADIKIPNAEALELKLRTGVTQILELLVALPVIPLDTKPLSLLEQLAEEPKTAGIARLAKRIIAALNIPMYSQGSSNQPYGGISDITNRGSFDRLLLSELAHDDISLMARLVNNEALYLRREQPPHNPKKQRVILIDTSIKMWGLPRVFAVSAAVACTLNTKHKEVVEAFTLTGDSFTDEDLSTKKGVITTLEKLDNSLYCTTGLDAFLQQTNTGDETDILFITHDAFVHTTVFQKLFATAGTQLNYIITVNRAGELVFNEVVNNNIKKISSAKFDLDELLSAPVNKQPVQKIKEEIEMPTFYQQRHQPLFFPTTGMRMTAKNISYNYKTGLYGITESQRLLHWPKKETGAREILNFIEEGYYCFGFENNTLQYVLVKCHLGKGLKLYKVDVKEAFNSEEYHINYIVEGELSAVYDQHCFYIKAKTAKNINVVIVDCNKATIISRWGDVAFAELSKKDTSSSFLRPFNELKKFINNGYNVFHRVHEIGISSSGNISFDYNELRIIHNSDFEWVPNQGDKKIYRNSAMPSEPVFLKSNPNTWVRKYTWPNKSYAMIDSNGLVHFKSSNNTLPEISLIMILGKPTACWSSNGHFCGSDYFKSSINFDKISPIHFHLQYIQPFIDNLK